MTSKILKPLLLTLLFGCFSEVGFSQTDPEFIKKLYNQSLTEKPAYEWLRVLTKQVGNRLSGSPGAAAAVEYTRSVMMQFSDRVELQPVLVPHWVRGDKEILTFSSQIYGSGPLSICALGGSVGTPPEGITAQVVEVKSFVELEKRAAEIKGKIVFFNRPMDPVLIETFAAYGGAVEQRGAGAFEASKYGAVAVIVRSMGSNPEDYPHTGAMNYKDANVKIPAASLATRQSDLLSARLKSDPKLTLHLELNCKQLQDAPSYNVIGEIKGSEFPDEIIVVGGHLDSWDLGEGAHDDGAGCVQSMEVLWLFKTLGYKPKRTIRAVMYMNEENGLRGGNEYANQAVNKKERNIAAIESDRGGFTPRGFTMDVTPEVKQKVLGWKQYFEPYGLTDFNRSGGGADIGPLKKTGTALFGYLPDSQRYFDYHHTSEDTFEKVNSRELELGAASMAALVYLIDQEGLPITQK